MSACLFRRDTFPSVRILAVDDTAMDVVFLHILLQELLQKRKAGTTVDVADKKNVYKIGQEEPLMIIESGDG